MKVLSSTASLRNLINLENTFTFNKVKRQTVTTKHVPKNWKSSFIKKLIKL